MSIISILELAGVAHLPKARHLIESLVLVEGYREAQVEFGSVAGEEQAKQTIDQFRDLVNRNQVQGNERNIDYWRKQGWDQFSAFVQEKSQEKSKTQVKRAKNEGRSVVLHETPRWLVVVPLDKDASCFHGKNTDWCTTKPFASHFEQYFYDREITLIYFLKLDTGDKWAIAAHTSTTKMEMFDQRDEPISASQFKQQTGFDPKEFRKKAIESDNVSSQTTEARQLYRQAIDRIQAKLPFTETTRELERDLMFTKNTQLILKYCESVKGRWKDVERWFVRDPFTALQYSERVIRGRWPELEKNLTDTLKSIDTSRAPTHADIRSVSNTINYAKGVLHARWPELERVLLEFNDASQLHEYASEVVRGRWPEVEPLLLQPNHLFWAVQYAESVFGGNRWPELEQMLLSSKNANYLMRYAADVIHGRWPEAEPIIIRDALPAANYASEAIRGPWPEAEATIKRDPMPAVIYAERALRSRWPEAEATIKRDRFSQLLYTQFLKELKNK